MAVDVLVQKYFRKAGCRSSTRTAPRDRRTSGEPRHRPRARRPPGLQSTGRVLDPLGQGARLLRHRTTTPTFHDELCYMLAGQFAAPNSPQWFNTGLHWAYGITGPAQGHWYADPETGKLKTSPSAYEHPQPHACFIQSVADDLVNAGGIMDLWVREARLFKYGSGTGTNFSELRGAERAALRRRPLIGSHVLPQDRRPRGGRRSSPAARPAARRRWCASISTTPTSRSSSPGRRCEERKVAALRHRLAAAQAPAPGNSRRGCFPNSSGSRSWMSRRTPTSRPPSGDRTAAGRA